MKIKKIMVLHSWLEADLWETLFRKKTAYLYPNRFIFSEIVLILNNMRILVIHPFRNERMTV